MNSFKFSTVFRNKLVLTALLMVAVLSSSFPSTINAMWEETDESLLFDGSGALVAAPIEAIFSDSEVAKEIALILAKDVTDVIAFDELKGIKELELRYSKYQIESLDGIEYLTELETLHCNYDALKSLDVSKNKKLVELHCVHNRLHSLHLDNPNLKVLNVTGNELTEIDTTKSPALSDLNVSLNNLTNLDLTQNPNLKRLKAIDNVGIVVADLHPDILKNKIHFNFSPKTYTVIDNMLIFN